MFCAYVYSAATSYFPAGILVSLSTDLPLLETHSKPGKKKVSPRSWAGLLRATKPMCIFLYVVQK